MKKKGSFLIESIVSVSLVVIGLLGILALVTRSISLNNNVHGRFIAANLAAEGIEVVKNIIDTNIAQANIGQGINWNKGLDDGAYELIYNSSQISNISDDPTARSNSSLRFNRQEGTYDYNPNNTVETPFKRTVQIINSSDRTTSMQVNSIVVWTVKGITSEINVEDHFYNWRQ